MAKKAILQSFVRHPEEAAIIGRLIAGYGELEFDLAYCVRWIINDGDAAFKVMFREPGEMQRVLMADALARTKLPSGRHEQSSSKSWRRNKSLQEDKESVRPLPLV